MKEKYYFCFLFEALILENSIQDSIEASSHFQIQVLKNHKSVGYTNPIPCIISPEGGISIGNECITFTTTYDSAQPNKNACQIRLIEIILGGQRLIGQYSFLLGNYVHASKNLLRSCIEMRVEIGQFYILQYVVYVQSTRQALEKIVKEHQTAKKLHMLDQQSSQIAQFLPEQIRDPKQETLVKVIQYDLSSPLIIHQRFFSPKKLRNKVSLASNEEDPTTLIASGKRKMCRSMQKDEKRRMSFMKMKKARSNMSDNTCNQFMNSIKSKKQKKYSHIIEQEVEVLAEPDDTSRSNQKLYEVITSNSKISGSPAASDSSLLNTNEHHVSSLQTPTQPNTPRTKPSGKYDYKTIILLVFLVIIVMFLLTISSKKPQRIKYNNTRANKKKVKQNKKF